MSQVLVLSSLYLLIHFVFAVPSYQLIDRHEVCETTECLNAASRIMSSMDTTADPCNTFYQYACGGWIKQHPIPADKVSISQFSLAAKRTDEKLKEILSSDSADDRMAVKKAKMFFKSCMNEDAIEELGSMPALELIEKFGGLPLISESSDNISLERYLAFTKNRINEEYAHISSPLINMDIVIDDKNSSNYIIKLDQPMLAMRTRDYYLKKNLEPTKTAFRQFMSDFLKEIWTSMDKNNNVTTFDSEALMFGVDEIMQLETDLAKITEPKDRRQDVLETYNKMSIRDMSSQISSDFNWFQFISTIMAKIETEVEPTTQIVIHGKPYLTKLPQVLSKYNNRVIKNYIVVYNLLRHVRYLSKKFRDTEIPYRIAIGKTSEEQPRWETCVCNTRALLKEPIGALFIENFFPEETKKVVTEMTGNVMAAFKEELDSIQWMDDKSKMEAIIKVDAIRKQVGSPEYISDKRNPKLDIEHKDVHIVDGQYFKNVHNFYNFQLSQSLKKLYQPVDRNSWGTIGAADVTAYYNRHLNTMIFPAAVMTPPFFDVGQPFSMNYGGIGDAMGHELTHGFDQSGSNYNEIGNLKNWWTNFSRNNFEEKMECLKRQYSTFYYETAKMFVNGNLTVGENIADNGGIRSTYYGYQMWKNANPGKEFQLPGLEKYTSEQLFFIANAQIWCGNDRPETAKRQILSDVHSPKIFRVLGAFKNFDKFAEAFSCKLQQDDMYPNKSDTCRVW